MSKPYSYDPKVSAKLLLAEGPKVTAPAARSAVLLAEKPPLVCTHAQHHCVLVFGGVAFTVPAGGLPWTGDSCVNFVLSAYHPDAKSGQVLLLGQNDRGPTGNAIAKGDMAKLNVVRYRGRPKPRGEALADTHPQTSQVPIQKKRTVVYSVRLTDLRRNDQLLLSAEMKTSNPHPYTARVSTQVILSDKSSGTDLDGPTRRIAGFHGEIGEYNGSNCLPNRTLDTRKYGTLRILKRAPEAFVNLVVTSAAPPPEVGQPRIAPKPNDAVKVERGELAITRFPPGAMR